MMGGRWAPLGITPFLLEELWRLMLPQVSGLELADRDRATLSHSTLQNQVFPDIRYAEDFTFYVFLLNIGK